MNQNKSKRQYIYADGGDLSDEKSRINWYASMLKSAVAATSDVDPKYLPNTVFMDQAKRWWADQKRQHRKDGVCEAIKKIMSSQNFKDAERAAKDASIEKYQFVSSMYCLMHHGYSYKFEKQEIVPADLEKVKSYRSSRISKEVRFHMLKVSMN